MDINEAERILNAFGKAFNKAYRRGDFYGRSETRIRYSSFREACEKSFPENWGRKRSRAPIDKWMPCVKDLANVQGLPRGEIVIRMHRERKWLW